MLKTKFYGIAIACAIGCFGISPVNVFAAETNSESVTLSEKDKDQGQKDKKAAFDDAIKKASEKWDSLTDKQKNEIYALIENEMKAEIKLTDKLEELGLLGKEDGTLLKARMQERFTELKKSGEFPFSRPNRDKKQR